jgi:hypothetical protein
VAKEKLIPDRSAAPEDDEREPHERFSDLAARIVTVPKSEIDKCEKTWRRRRKRPQEA